MPESPTGANIRPESPVRAGKTKTGNNTIQQPDWRTRIRKAVTPRKKVIPATGTGGTALVIVVAAMSFFACLALGATLIVHQSVTLWSAEITGTLTVQVRPHDDIPADEQIRAALSVLETTAGIRQVQVLPRSDVHALLEPWLGVDILTPEFLLPRLVDVKVDPQAQPDLALLSSRLESAAPGLVLDTHKQWLDTLLGATKTARGLALLVLMTVGMTTIAIVTFAAHAGLSANHPVVEVLHLAGARDAFIAEEMQRHFWRLGWRGGGVGLVAACGVFLLMEYTLTGEDALFFLPVPSLHLPHYFWLLLVPLALAITVALTARIVTLKTLKRMI